MANDNRYLRKGSVVTIRLYKDDKAVTPGMMKYDGQQAAISRVCRPKNSARILGGSPYGYELEGIESEYGIPYTFTRDMIY